MSNRAEIDRTLIGSSASAFMVEVEKGAIRRFAEAIGESAKAYFDDAFARSLGYPGIVAPPTFPTTFRPPSRPPWLCGLDEGRILAGEQEFSYWRPIVAGDQLRCELHLADIQDKRGSKGMMQLIIQDLIVTAPMGEKVCINRRVVIYRDPDATLTQGVRA